MYSEENMVTSFLRHHGQLVHWSDSFADINLQDQI